MQAGQREAELLAAQLRAAATPQQQAALKKTVAMAATTNAVVKPAQRSCPGFIATNFATEWLDELGHVCPKVVDYATQCPKGHALVASADRGSDTLAQHLLCRVCHVITEREHASHWRVCGVAGCCADYAVCQCCVSALQQAPDTTVGGGDFIALVSGAEYACVSRGCLNHSSHAVVRRVLPLCTCFG